MHRRIMIVLAVVLPAAFVAGLAARKPPAPANPAYTGVRWSGHEPSSIKPSAGTARSGYTIPCCRIGFELSGSLCRAQASVIHPNATAETLLIRGFGTAALLLLHVILCIGPLCRLDRRFLLCCTTGVIWV